MTAVTTTDLLRVRAALAVGVPPSEALAAIADHAVRERAADRPPVGGGLAERADGGLAATARMVRLGQPLADAARRVPVGSGPLGAGPLLRALALAERCGQGGVEAVDVALGTRHDALLDEQRLQARSAQAVGTAKLLTVLPIAAWVLLVAVDPAALGFYATRWGWLCAAVTIVLGVTSHRWSRRLVRRASAAAALADPLATPGGAFDRTRAAVIAAPVLLTLWVVVHPLVGLAAGGFVAAVAGRSGRGAPPACSTLEVVQLLRMVLVTETGLAAALDHVAEVTAAPVSEHMRAVARRLRAGSDVEQAFADTGLAEVGAVLAVTEHWGIAATEPLRLLSDAVRARQRAAAEAAAERVQLALVFPTTLLTLPAFVIAIVPPLVWTALAG